MNELTDVNRPGIQRVVERLGAMGGSLSPEACVDGCLDLAGPLSVAGPTRQALIDATAAGGDVDLDTDESRQASAGRIARLLQLIVATREFQFA